MDNDADQTSRLTSTDLRYGQLPAGMTDGLAGVDWPPAAHLHVAIADDGKRHLVQTLRQGRRTSTRVVEVTMRWCNGPFDATGGCR